MILSERAQFLVDNLDLPAATGIADARFEHFQLSLWSDDGTFRIENKSRQIAWSFALAADFTADAVLAARDGIFVSINLEEAKEKIRYAKAIYENLRIGGLPKIVRDNALGLELSNGARLNSLPSKPVRGRAKANVGLDEFAHAQRDRQIYAGSLPVISKGGRLRIGSSPMGASGVFWEVFTDDRGKYSGYKRNTTPWWHVYSFCTNVRQARRLAKAMPTAQRVELFGNERIKAIYSNMALEDFQTEYECAFVDEQTAFITWDEIKDVQLVDLVCPTVTAKGSITPEVWEAIKAWRKAAREGHAEQVFALGIDIGRTRNTTEITAVGLSDLGLMPMRLGISLDNLKFDDQIEVISNVMSMSNQVVLCFVDETGIGKQLAEKLAELHPGRVEPKTFTNASKNLWATGMKLVIQQKKTFLPVDKELAYQIHSIKKIVSTSKMIQYDTAKAEKHHADKFWALALAYAAGAEAAVFDLGVLGEVFGGR